MNIYFFGIHDFGDNKISKIDILFRIFKGFQGSEGNPECMIFTPNTYQATFIGEIF